MSIFEPAGGSVDGVTRTSDVEVARQRRGPAATGEVLNRGGAFAVCLGRSFTVPPDVVWEWLTDPDRMRIWLGESDEPGADEEPGQRSFHLAGDAADAPRLDYAVERFEPITRITLSLRESPSADATDGRSWRLDLALTPTETGCHLMLEQTITDRVPAPSVAAGCEFYLDRLVRACHGRHFSDLDYDDYFLAQAPAYRRMFPLPRGEAGDATV